MSSLQLTSLQLHNLSAPASVHSSASTPMRIQHDPYKHSCFFGSSIKSDASSQDDEWIPTPPQMSQRNTAPSTPYHRPAAGAVTSIPEHTSAAPTELMHEGALSGRCELLVTPLGVQDIEQPTPMGKPSLFLGHMRFETTAAELRWLIFTTTGVRVLKCEPRAAGCFVVHLDNENDVSLVRSLHKRLLFDLGGVWFARTKEQVAIMADYIQEKLAPKRSRREKVRVPHDALCVETQKTQARRPQPAPLMHHGNVPLPPFYYGQQQAFSAVPPAYYDAAAYGAPCMGYGY